MTLDSKGAALVKVTPQDTHTMKTGAIIMTPSTGKEIIQNLVASRMSESAPSAEKTGQKIQDTGANALLHLYCPQCRHNHLTPRQGTVTVARGKETKKVPTAFAECGYCGLVSTVEERQFTRELYLVESYFPNDPCVELS